VHAQLGAALGLVAGAAEIGLEAVLAAQQHGSHGVVESAQYRCLDLDHVHRPHLGQGADIIEAVAPLVGYDLHGDPAALQFLAQGAQSLVVKSAITHVDRSLDAQGQGFGGVSQPAQIGGHLRYVGIEDEAESSVDVHVELRLVIGRGARGQDAPAQPGHVVEETTAVCAELVWDVVDQTVR